MFSASPRSISRELMGPALVLVHTVTSLTSVVVRGPEDLDLLMLVFSLMVEEFKTLTCISDLLLVHLRCSEMFHQIFYL